jgi:hypothetical protein
MFRMFYSVKRFNKSLDSFDTSHVSNMEYMFFDASNFIKPLYFDTTSAMNMNSMFPYCKNLEKCNNYELYDL